MELRYKNANNEMHEFRVAEEVLQILVLDQAM